MLTDATISGQGLCPRRYVLACRKFAALWCSESNDSSTRYPFPLLLPNAISTPALRSNPTTGNWVYPGASSTMPTLPPHMMYVPQAPQQPIWHVPADATNRQMPLMPVGTSPVAASASSGKKESGTEKSRSRTMWPVPVWEERHVGEGKMAWIHKETRQVVYDDPYM